MDLRSCREKDQSELQEIIRLSISCSLREAAKRLNRGVRYTRKLTEALEIQLAIKIIRYKRVSDWRLQPYSGNEPYELSSPTQSVL